MKKAIAKLACAVAVASALCGCTSAMMRCTGMAWGEPYEPTLVAYAYTPEVPILWADLPFDAVLDTAFLPIDLVIMPFIIEWK